MIIDRYSEAVRAADRIPGWYHPDQLRYLELLATTTVGPKEKIVEVGTWFGRSAYVLAYVAALKEGELICVDTWRGLPQSPLDNRYEAALTTNVLHAARNNLAVFGATVRFEVGESSIVLPSIPTNYAALIHIDGDHSLPVVEEDVLSGWRIARKGGVICGDDYNEPDVQTAVRALGIVPEVKGKLWWVVKV